MNDKQKSTNKVYVGNNRKRKRRMLEISKRLSLFFRKTKDTVIVSANGTVTQFG